MYWKPFWVWNYGWQYKDCCWMTRLPNTSSTVVYSKLQLFSGQSVSRLLDSLPEGMAKKEVPGINVFHKAVIRDLQKELLIEDVLLRAPDMSRSIGQKAADSLQHCRVAVSHRPSIQPGEEMKVGGEWIRYQEMNVTEDDQNLCVDHFWKKCSPRKITVETSLKCCQKWSNVL